MDREWEQQLSTSRGKSRIKCFEIPNVSSDQNTLEQSQLQSSKEVSDYRQRSSDETINSKESNQFFTNWDENFISKNVIKIFDWLHFCKIRVTKITNIRHTKPEICSFLGTSFKLLDYLTIKSWRQWNKFIEFAYNREKIIDYLFSIKMLITYYFQYMNENKFSSKNSYRFLINIFINWFIGYYKKLLVHM